MTTIESKASLCVRPVAILAGSSSSRSSLEASTDPVGSKSVITGSVAACSTPDLVRDGPNHGEPPAGVLPVMMKPRIITFYSLVTRARVETLTTAALGNRGYSGRRLRGRASPRKHHKIFRPKAHFRGRRYCKLPLRSSLSPRPKGRWRPQPAQAHQLDWCTPGSVCSRTAGNRLRPGRCWCPK